MSVQKFKLAIGDFVGVKIEGEYSNQAGESTPYSLVLECKRLGAAELSAEMEKEGRTFAGFFETVATGWREQTLVLNEDGSPASFGADALAALLATPNMPAQAWAAYVAQVGVRQKNSLKPRA